TVDEYLKGREAFTSKDVVRDPKVAERAREELRIEMEEKVQDELLSDGALPHEAEIDAKKMVSQKMATLAALHNPDLFAGGRDVIADFGDRRINSSLGAQWPSRITGLDDAAQNIPRELRNATTINAKLKRCE
ncbi:polymorphic toxin type 15 domain-containing protein, partial [Pseudomonas viridiflava]